VEGKLSPQSFVYIALLMIQFGISFVFIKHDERELLTSFSAIIIPQDRVSRTLYNLASGEG